MMIMIYDLVASAWFEAMIGRAPRILLDTLRDDDGSHINAVMRAANCNLLPSPLCSPCKKISIHGCFTLCPWIDR
jgi:hypothetical protein